MLVNNENNQDNSNNNGEFEDIDYNNVNDRNPIFFSGTEFIREYKDTDNQIEELSDEEDREDHSFIEVESYMSPQSHFIKKFKGLSFVIGGIVLLLLVFIGLFVIIKHFNSSGDASPIEDSQHIPIGGDGSSKIRQTNPLIILSLDGFRWDYLDRGLSPNILSLASNGGVRAKWVSPQFPSKTFPNHYSMVTGLLPEYHGIISNTMYDPDTNRTFSIRYNAGDSYWYGGEPIWVTAARNGLITACCLYPGCNAVIKSISPDYSVPYQDTPPSKVVEQLTNWLDGPKPNLTLGYFYLIDHFGHGFGPDSDQVNQAIVEVDNSIGVLIDHLKSTNTFENTNIVIYSDHGMTQLSSQQEIFIDQCIDVTKIHIVEKTPILSIFPIKNGLTTQEIYDQLKNCHTNLTMYFKETIPSSLYFSSSSQIRIAPIIGIADLGWFIRTAGGQNTELGDHGYIPTNSDMHSIFIAHGPNIKSLPDPIESFSNLEYFNFFTKLLNFTSGVSTLPLTNSTNTLIDLLYIDDKNKTKESNL